MVDGPDPYEHNPNDAWWRPGWTSQNHFFIAPDAEPPNPDFPDVPMVALTAIYMDGEGEPVESSVLIRPNATWRDTETGTTVMPRVRRYRFNGTLDIELPASDAPELEAPFTYTVKEIFSGGQQFAINVPAASAGGTPVEIHSLKVDPKNIIPIDTVPPMHGFLNYPATI